MITHYLKVGLRTLLKYKSQSIISAICLAIGIVVFSFCIFFIRYTNQDTRFPDYEQRLHFVLESEQTATSTYFYSYDIQKLSELHIKGIDSLSIYSFSEKAEINAIDKEQNEKPFIIDYKCVNSFFFSYYDMPLMYGNRLPTKPNEIVISQDFAHKIYGNENPIGMSLHMVEDQGIADNQIKDFIIVNTVSNTKKELNLDADCYFPLETHPGIPLNVDSRMMKDGKLDEIKKQTSKSNWERGGETIHAQVYSISQKRTEEGGSLIQLLILFVSSLILISGLINFLKFIIQMFINRQRELAIRKCVGSNTKGLYLLLFAEIFWMMSFALLLSFILTEITISSLKIYVPQDELPNFPLSEIYILQFLVYTISLLICLLSILFPIHRLHHVSIIHYVTRNNKKHSFRNVMIGIQLGISMFFVGSLLIINLSFGELFGQIYTPLNAEKESHIISLSVNSQRMKQNIEAILSDINALPDIIDKTSSTYPISTKSYTYMNYEKPDKSIKAVAVSTGDPHYFSFFQIPLNGKVVEAEAGENIYISEKFQKQLKQDNVQGAVTLNGKSYSIAGVYKALYKEFEKKSQMVGSVFIPSSNYSSYYFKTSPTGNVNENIQNITKICRNYVPDTLPVDIQAMDNNQKDIDGILYMMRNLLIILAIISILLVILSVYSAISMDTISRQKEVAIRKINGATPRNIAMLFGKVYILVFLFTFTIIYPLLRLVMIHVMGKSGISCVYGWGWGIILFIIIALLLFVVTGYKIFMIMHINPATIIKNE